VILFFICRYDVINLVRKIKYTEKMLTRVNLTAISKVSLAKPDAKIEMRFSVKIILKITTPVKNIKIILIILLAVTSLAVWVLTENESEHPQDPPVNPIHFRDHIQPVVPILPDIQIDPTCLNHPTSVLFDGASASGVVFTLRNTTGMGLHYRDGYRLYRYTDGEWEHLTRFGSADRLQEINQYIEKNQLQVFYTNWGREVEPGRYRYERDFFPDLEDMDNYLTVAFVFYVRHWSEWEEEEGTPEAIAALQQARQVRIDFAISGAGPNEFLVPVGYIVVSQTSINFSIRNRSDVSLMYGREWELAQYVDGRWQPVPYRPEIARQGGRVWIQPAPPVISRGNIKETSVDFWDFGDYLTPGRYLFLSRQGLTYLMFEFTIDENTPLKLNEFISILDRF